MIQDKSTYLSKGYWLSGLAAFRKAFALTLKVFKVVGKNEKKISVKDFFLVTKDDKFTCTSCEQCMIICPTDCISIKGDKVRERLDSLTIDVKKCISCYLCQDICPEDALYLGEQKSPSDQKVIQSEK